MKRITAILLAVLALLALHGCAGRNPAPTEPTTETTQLSTTKSTMEEAEETSMQTLLKIEINGQTLLADFEDNSSAAALQEKLREGSLTLEMEEYGGFEKVGSLPFSLPRNDKSITTKPGDVILYQGNMLTIYYDTNTWSFTKVATVRATQSELKALLGNGDITATFSLENA